MRWRARAVAIATVVVAALVQGAVVSRLAIPLSLVPVVVLAAALRLRPLEAAVLGFAAGLTVDLLPPAAGTLGANALVGTLLGLAAVSWFDRVPHVWWARGVYVGVLSTFWVAGAWLVAFAVGQQVQGWGQFGWNLLGQLVLGTALAFALVPALRTWQGAAPGMQPGVAR